MKKQATKLPGEKRILRDDLALDRTILANERTFLSYIRTMLAVIVVGASLIHLSTDPLMDALGSLSILIGIAIMVIGVRRTMAMSRLIYQRKA